MAIVRPDMFSTTMSFVTLWNVCRYVGVGAWAVMVEHNLIGLSDDTDNV